MGDEIQEPVATCLSPSSGGLAAGAIYLGTTLSMLIAMPQQDIGILSGILQGINIMASRTGIIAVVVPIALLECISILGTASAWFSGTARIPFVAGIDRYLPPVIGKIHPKYEPPTSASSSSPHSHPCSSASVSLARSRKATSPCSISP